MQLLTHLFFLVTIMSFLDPDPQAGIRILRIGTYHQDEVSMEDAGEWFALVQSGPRFQLRPVRVSVTPVHDEIDEDPESLNGRLVTADATPDPVILLRGDIFRSREVTAVVAQAHTLALGEAHSLGSAVFSLGVEDTTVIAGQWQYHIRLWLQQGNVSQPVATYSGYSDDGKSVNYAAERPPQILWAGDLDGDRRLDFLLDTSDHYNVEELTLYLSSQAHGGVLVQASATIRRVGC